MKSPNSDLASHMAFLLSIPPESNLAKLLKLCLITQFDGQNLGKTALEYSRSLIEDPNSLPYWIQEVIGSDQNYTSEEWAAYGDMKLTNIEEFLNKLYSELDILAE